MASDFIALDWGTTSFRAYRVAADGHVLDSPVLVTPGMPILDAVEIAQFLMETSITFERYRADQDKRTIGGPIDIAMVTQHSGFRWVQRKRAAPGRRSTGKL